MKSDKLILPTNKKFGFFFSFIFLFLSIYFIYNFSLILSLFFGSLFLITLFLTFFSPDLLLPFNKLWFKIGLVLNKIVSPLLLGLIFYLLITPTAVVMRLLNRDELKIKKKKNTTYWRTNESNNIVNHNFKNQF